MDTTNTKINWKGIEGEIINSTKLYHDVKVLNDDAPYHTQGEVIRIYKKWID